MAVCNQNLPAINPALFPRDDDDDDWMVDDGKSEYSAVNVLGFGRAQNVTHCRLVRH